MAAAQELVTRKFTGHREDGTPMYEVTRHGRPRPPESYPEWVEHRLAGLGSVRTLPACRVYAGLLEAAGDAEIKAAVAAGGNLNEWTRWDVLTALKAARDKAGDYPPARPVVEQLVQAWTARWGAREPRRAG